MVESTYEKAEHHSDAPVLLNIGGIPGSGKSTLVETLSEKLPSFTVIRLDAIMTAHPGYQAESKISASDAFSKYEMPARAAGYLLLKMLVEKNADILFEYSATTNDHLRFMIYSRRMGYKTILARVLTDPEVARARVRDRQKSDGRHVPENLIDERLRAILRLEKRYRSAVHLFRDVGNYRDINAGEHIFSEDLIESMLNDIRGLRDKKQDAKCANSTKSALLNSECAA